MLRVKDDFKLLLHELIWFDFYFIKYCDYLCKQYFSSRDSKGSFPALCVNVYGSVSLNLVVHMTKTKKDLCVTRSGKWTWITWRGIPVSNNKILLRN